MGRVDLPRRVAYETLSAVRERDAYANLALPALLRRSGLQGRDAALATALAHGTIRLQGSYDAILDTLVRHRLDPRVRDVLRLGVHQLLSMRVPRHAAVSTSVELVREVAGERPVRLTNAVLRKVAAHELETWLARVAPPRESDPAGHLAVRHSHPRWVVERLHQAVNHPGGADWAATEALLAADNVPPTVSLGARPGRSDLGELLAAGAEPGRWSPVAATWPAGDPTTIPAVREGRAAVQDEGSQLVAIALTRVHLGGTEPGTDRAPERWLDLCAGPGGKAALLAGLAIGHHADLLAVERQPHRARLVAEALDGLPRAWTVVADGTRPAWPARRFDRVLVDAPCTGLGALRRRPEARWRRREDDLPALVALQGDLLRAALESCAPGGVVAYVTCSPVVEETVGVVQHVLGGRADTVQLDARPMLPGVPDLGPGPHVQLWPHVHGTDAMFLALLRRAG